MSINTKSLLKLSNISPCLCGDPSCSSCGPEIVQQEREITTAVRALSEATIEALKAVGRATGLLDDLTGKLWDVELVEGMDGEDIADELASAGLSLRHAHRIVRERMVRLPADDEPETPTVVEQPKPSGLSDHGEPCRHPNHEENL